MNKPTEKRSEKPFSVLRFALIITLTLAFFALVLSFAAPAVWEASLAAPLWKWGVVFLAMHAFCGFAEFFFHRYILHAPFPLLERMHTQHTLHHSLTNVKLVAVSDGRGRVFNRYPILEERQHEASYFPWYSLAGFVGVFSPVTVFLQGLFPEWPVAAGIVLAIAWSVSLYEIVHMIEHFSFEEFWKPKVMHRYFGKWWTLFYCFHLRHHADIMSNENISGFFGVPLADFMFRTYAPWPRVFLHQESVPQSEFEARSPQPCRFIRFLDTVL